MRVSIARPLDQRCLGSYRTGTDCRAEKNHSYAGLAALALAFVVGWQIASSKLAYYELRADLLDIASQNAVRIGLAAQYR